ncbi:MAG TPA: four helix bundle protein [Planctomycetota bacterium]|nr:four helix bundle protein [Planctomycetota bacterium]
MTKSGKAQAPHGDERSTKAFDLEERTANFGEAVIQFANQLSQNPVTTPLIRQVVRSAGSIGANYGEADDAQSKKEFRQKISYCKKEARETKHWLRMIAAAVPDRKEDIRALWQEAKELHLIFAAIWRRSKGDS